MKLSLLTTSLLLTGALFASNTHQMSATQEGVHAVKLFDTTLTTNLQKITKGDSNSTISMNTCTTEADRTMLAVNNELPTHIKISIASLDSNSTSHATDLEIMKKYKQDIKNKTAAAMMITTAKVGETTRVYKPLVIDSVWVECLDANSTVKLGEFKGVIISEVSKSTKTHN